MTNLKQDIENKHGTLYQAAKFAGVESNQLTRLVERFPASKTYLSTKLLLAKILGLTLRQFERKYFD